MNGFLRRLRVTFSRAANLPVGAALASGVFEASAVTAVRQVARGACAPSRSPSCKPFGACPFLQQLLLAPYQVFPASSFSHTEFAICMATTSIEADPSTTRSQLGFTCLSISR